MSYKSEYIPVVSCVVLFSAVYFLYACVSFSYSFFFEGGLELRGSMDQVQKRGSLNHGACFVLTQKKQIAEQRHAALSINQSINRPNAKMAAKLR